MQIEYVMNAVNELSARITLLHKKIEELIKLMESLKEIP